MRVVASLALVLMATVYAEEDPEISTSASLNGRVIEVETGESANANNTDDRSEKKELQKQSVKMIVGGQSTDGVAKEVVVSPEQ